MSVVEAETLEAEVHPEPVSRFARLAEGLATRVSRLEERVDTLDSMLEALVASVEDVRRSSERGERALAVLRMVGEWKRRTCRFHSGGVCRAWRAPTNAPIPVEVDEAGVTRPKVGDEPLLCAVCPLYEPRR